MKHKEMPYIAAVNQAIMALMLSANTANLCKIRQERALCAITPISSYTYAKRSTQKNTDVT